MVQIPSIKPISSCHVQREISQIITIHAGKGAHCYWEVHYLEIITLYFVTFSLYLFFINIKFNFFFFSQFKNRQR